jgi:hypothetical protein
MLKLVDRLSLSIDSIDRLMEWAIKIPTVSIDQYNRLTKILD